MFVVGGIVLALVFGLLAVFARPWWWISSAWAYRNAEANEPSDAAYAIQRVIAGVLALVCLIGGIVLQVSTAQQEDRAARCATVTRLADGVEVDRKDELQSRLEKRGFTVAEGDPVADQPSLDVTHGSDEVAAILWADETSAALVTCS